MQRFMTRLTLFLGGCPRTCRPIESFSPFHTPPYAIGLHKSVVGWPTKRRHCDSSRLALLSSRRRKRCHHDCIPCTRSSPTWLSLPCRQASLASRHSLGAPAVVLLHPCREPLVLRWPVEWLSCRCRHCGQRSHELVAMGTDMGIEQRCDALRWRDGKTSIRSHRNGQTSSDERLEDWLSGHQ